MSITGITPAGPSTVEIQKASSSSAALAGDEGFWAFTGNLVLSVVGGYAAGITGAAATGGNQWAGLAAGGCAASVVWNSQHGSKDPGEDCLVGATLAVVGPFNFKEQ